MSDKYKDNSIFVAALREHLQRGTLDKRVDNLLTDSAAGDYSYTTFLSLSPSPSPSPSLQSPTLLPLS